MADVSSSIPEIVVDDLTITAEEVFGVHGWTPEGRALAAVNPDLAKLLQQEARHNLPSLHVPPAPDPRLVEFHRNRAAVNESLHYAGPAEPATPQKFTDSELGRFDLSLYFGKDSQPGKANQLGMSNPGLYRALRSKAVAAGIIR